MGLGCGASCLKVLMFIFNGLFFVFGAALLGIGIWLRVDPNISEKFNEIAVGTDDMFMAATIVVIVIGAMIFLIGFFGCCGACTENSCMLCTFIVFISIIFVLEIVAAILAGVFHKELGTSLRDEMAQQAIQHVEPINTNGTNDATSLAWHRMQEDLKCCGGNDYSDYKNSSHFNTPANRLPKTCCLLTNDDAENPMVKDWPACQNEYTTDNPGVELFADGCYTSLVDWLESKAMILVGVAIGVAVLQIMGLIFACCLRREIAKTKEYV